MLKVIKSELLKYLSGKMVYICCLVAALLPIFDYTLTNALSSMDAAAAADIGGRFAGLSMQQYMINSLLSSFSGGSILILAIITASSVISEDYGSGTMKYSLLAVSRKKMILGKIMTVGIINSFFILVLLITNGALGIVCFQWDKESFTLMQLFEAYFISWLCLLGFNCLIIYIINKVSKIIAAIGLGIGVYFILTLLGVIIPKSLNFMVINYSILNLAYMNDKAFITPIISALIYITAFTALTIADFSRKEILY